MLSLIIFCTMLAVSFTAQAAVIVIIARRILSSPVRWRSGFEAIFIATIASLLIVSAPALIQPPTVSPSAKNSTLVMTFVINVVVMIAIIAWRLKLNFKQALLPFAGAFAVSLFGLLIVDALILPFVLETFIASTQTMSPTLIAGDRFVANKILRPRRWDLVAYWAHFPKSPPAIHCKRIIGLPHDSLRFSSDGQLYVNGQLAASPAVLAGRLHASIPNYSSQLYCDDESIQLGDDEFFVVGDNIDVSADSRLMGPSKVSDLVGVVDLRYWPLNRISLVR
jgi:signal peptidase I